MIYIILTGLIALGLAIVYGVVLYFSHIPRLETPSELTYITNDFTENSYDLPPRLTSQVGLKDQSLHGRGSIELSVVIPCYNETNRLGKMLDEATEYLNKNYKENYEILIVDDGSSDGTDDYALRKATQLKLAPHILRVIKLSSNRGKGGAVTHGLLHSRGRLALFADADGATKFSDVKKLMDWLNQLGNKPGVAIGSRSHMVDTDAVVKRSFIRNFLMYGLHTLVYIFGIRAIQDTQCGFKMFNQESVSKVFPHMHTERWIFDVEVLLLCEIQGIAMQEVPVNWQEIDGSKIDLAKDSIGMAIDLVVTRIAYLIGTYKLNECGRLSKKHQ
ncbi:hypothetical protein HYPBUDRAFT_154040 [Hyphopichia burtonii NRRL Y-1933]|uniref:dolichyl-phosphate beta-glucosyltransferase n=1 Tax=Hyphopichia burtonii NRRL Y-1933 TaxID=984485 RepID=A0A1E4RD49_9ASCO|nr:hypothetical protein HYPBUDRAFT_154040 [Hyphopichia burtonii NRRL Y-1933]ODV65194.1 hypothetical protein HYPBUDRAFT_154040 [Hyphopichia burtonii NRRL Y-1933]